MTDNLPTCPKCGNPADDVMGDICGHEVHTPHVAAERERLEQVIRDATPAPTLDELERVAVWLGVRPSDLVEMRRGDPAPLGSAYWQGWRDALAAQQRGATVAGKS